MDNHITQIAHEYISQETPLKDYFIIAGVCIAVITFLYQIHINKKQFRMQTFFNYTDRYQNIIINLPVDIESENFDCDKLKDDDIKWFRAYFDLCSEEFYLSKSNLIDNDVWELWKSGLEASLQKPAFQYSWKKIQKNKYYCEEFEKFITTILNSNSKV